MNANILFYYDNTTDVFLHEDNAISGDQLEFHSCDRNVIYYTIAQPEHAGQESLLLKAELDKAVVAYNMMFLIKKVSLIKAKDLNPVSVAVPVKELVTAFA
ncbi:hypothetical protein [Botryobacter ruber]|uniref:hypothetical protein n=1 Tax=Botryobacter ruber TaxID=2171629 RepID=UPI000FEC576B|nr:hypothetical protein [Botryobacter ruber]